MLRNVALMYETKYRQFCANVPRPLANAPSNAKSGNVNLSLRILAIFALILVVAWQNGFLVDFCFCATGFFRGFSRRFFSPRFCGEKVLRKILQENPRENPPKFIQPKSSDTRLQIGRGNLFSLYFSKKKRANRAEKDLDYQCLILGSSKHLPIFQEARKYRLSLARSDDAAAHQQQILQQRRGPGRAPARRGPLPRTQWPPFV